MKDEGFWRGIRALLLPEPKILRQSFRKVNIHSGGDLTVQSQVQDGQLLFSVSDTGVGLPIEKMDQIFSAFFTTKPQGSGMGPAISRSIVASRGGQLWATGNGGQGAVFHFNLPTEVTEASPSSSNPFSIFNHETTYDMSLGGS